MSERTIAVMTFKFYVEDENDGNTKFATLFDKVEEVMDCPDCEEDHECDDECQHRCNMLGTHLRLMTEEEFDREFLSDE